MSYDGHGLGKLIVYKFSTHIFYRQLVSNLLLNKVWTDLCDDLLGKEDFQDVDVRVQVRFVPELWRQRLETYFPHRLS